MYAIEKWMELQAISTLVFTVGLIVLNSDLARAKVAPGGRRRCWSWAGWPPYFLTPVSWLPGLAWLLLGLLLWSGKREGGRQRVGPG